MVVNKTIDEMLFPFLNAFVLWHNFTDILKMKRRRHIYSFRCFVIGTFTLVLNTKRLYGVVLFTIYDFIVNTHWPLYTVGILNLNTYIHFYRMTSWTLNLIYYFGTFLIIFKAFEVLICLLETNSAHCDETPVLAPSHQRLSCLQTSHLGRVEFFSNKLMRTIQTLETPDLLRKNGANESKPLN